MLDGGGKQMLGLGELGLDLGEIVADDLRRVARARDAGDLHHAELAARDLAARLRRPEPSFSGGGGHGGGHGGGQAGGVESGTPAGAGEGEGEPSSADEEAAADEHDLEELARDHAGEIGDVEDALERAVSPEELEAAAAGGQGARRRDPRGGEAPAAAARRHGLGRGRRRRRPRGGRGHGRRPRGGPPARRGRERPSRRARSSARRSAPAEQSGGFFPEDKAGPRGRAGAKPTLERELAWAEDALEKLRRAVRPPAPRAISSSTARTSSGSPRTPASSRKKGEGGDRSMPQEMLDRLDDAEQAMRDAERALGQGDGENGLRKQRDAQRFLEMARGEREEGDRERPAATPTASSPTGKAEVPGKDKHKGPDEFRKRVLEGLGGSSDPLLRDAVKRYAEGLLK